MRTLLFICIAAIPLLSCESCSKSQASAPIVRTANDYNVGNTYLASQGNYYVLEKNVPFVEQVKGRKNSFIEIRDVYDLNGKTVNIPEGCVLLFRGGALKNGSIVGKATIIDAPNYQIFLSPFLVSGSFNNTSFYADWFNNIQEAVNIASVNSGIIQLSAKVYDLDEPLEIKKGITLLGCGNEAAFRENRGTMIRNRGDEPVIKLSGETSPVKNITIKNLKIRGNGKDGSIGTNVGLLIGPKAYYCKFENISLYGCLNGVEIDNGWNLNFESVNAYYCKNGYYLNGKNGAPLTTTVFNSCVVYNSSVGFNLSSDMNATTLMSCGTDGCETSMKLAGCFGVSVVSYEFEKHTKYGIHIDNPDCYVTFVGLSPRALGSPNATHVKIDRVGRVTFTDMYLSNSVVPKDGYTIDVKRSSAKKVFFNNCVIKGKGKNLEDCHYIGDN